MEDVYFLNYDCISSLRNHRYIKFKYYFSIQLINRLFYSKRYPVYSLYTNSDKYPTDFIRLNELYFPNLTSLKIECDSFPTQNININLIHLQKLKIKINGKSDCSSSIFTFQKLSNLTYLSLSSTLRYSKYGTQFDLENYTHLKYLKLRNICFNNDIVKYFQQSTNLLSLIRIFTECAFGTDVILRNKNNYNLKYLRLEKVSNVELYGMTQLETKILNNNRKLSEC